MTVIPIPVTQQIFINECLLICANDNIAANMVSVAANTATIAIIIIL